MKFIIEHFGKVYKWHFIEYKHISKIVGKKNLIFTNTRSRKLKSLGKVYAKSVAELGFDKICILDPAAKMILNPQDCRHFNYLVFGGILGDYPPRQRTKEMISSKLPKADKRNLGKEQLPTDNAVFVAKKIAEGKSIRQLKFVSNIELKIGKKLSVILPFKYALVNGKPLIAKELIDYLKKRKTI